MQCYKFNFSQDENQLYIAHQIRNSCKFVPYKDRKAICADLKKIYSAVNLDDAEYAKEEFREKWDNKYPNIMKSWDRNWNDLTTFFKYPAEIRKIIYTTNAAESYLKIYKVKCNISDRRFYSQSNVYECKRNFKKMEIAHKRLGTCLCTVFCIF